MINLHGNQKKILEYLLNKPEGATLEDLASHLEVTKTAAKEHLLKVERLGYIAHKDSKGLVGRPKRSYFLSPEGHEAFPRQYSWLSSVLLELLAEDLGPKMVARIMKDLAKKVAGSMATRFKDKSSADLLIEITKALNELGYRAFLKQTDLRKGAILEATNCVYHSVAKEHPELCQFDVQFIEEASGFKVKLESCIARGGETCRFCIKK
ncbi:helix-turn-helix transcriptional regulator [Peredibacter sp. HCB2-198]|uniref:helix-turn-helix transcriptional regulator n=1 Tax=Peredibacter sp. HCB2-198 TaxID=3383025 RepID=UPI0038B551B4